MKYSHILISWTYLCRWADLKIAKKNILKFPQNLITKFCCSQKDHQLKTFFKPLQDISKYHHFIFNQEQPGTIYVQKSIGSELLMVDIIKDT